MSLPCGKEDSGEPNLQNVHFYMLFRHLNALLGDLGLGPLPADPGPEDARLPAQRCELWVYRSFGVTSFEPQLPAETPSTLPQSRGAASPSRPLVTQSCASWRNHPVTAPGLPGAGMNPMQQGLFFLLK